MAKFLRAIGQLLQFILTTLSLLYCSAYAGINYLFENDLPTEEVKNDNNENTEVASDNLEIQTPITIQDNADPEESDKEAKNESKDDITEDANKENSFV